MGLCTLASVKEWLSIAVADTSFDALLTRLIAAESGYIERWCDRVFLSASYTEKYNGTGTGRLQLRHTPITAVSSLTINGQAIPLSTSPTVAGFAFDDLGLYLIGAASAQVAGPGWPAGIGYFPAGWQNIEVAYTAGFATVPDDVAQACIELVSMRFNERKRVGKTSETLAGQVVSYDTKAMTEPIKALLEKYRRVVPM